MKISAVQPLWTSIILHSTVFVLLLLGVLFEAFRPKPKVHVFQMVSPPTVSQPTPEVNNPSPQVLPEFPEIDPLPKISEAAARPDPIPTKNDRTVPSPVINYEEFVREHGKPKPRKTTTSRAVPQPSIPTISTPRLELPANSTASQQPTAQELSALERYSAQLNVRIKAAWIAPDLGGTQAIVTVVFEVSASGQIMNLRLQSSSGQLTFDQSIRDAFRKIANAGPTPTGRSHRFSMRFENTR
ncbi:MAG: TonB family protein [Coraliomargaritaceae bacterium]